MAEAKTGRKDLTLRWGRQRQPEIETVAATASDPGKNDKDRRQRSQRFVSEFEALPVCISLSLFDSSILMITSTYSPVHMVFHFDCILI